MLLIPNKYRNICLTANSCLVEDVFPRKIRNVLYIECGRQSVVLLRARAVESDTPESNPGSSIHWQCNFRQVTQPLSASVFSSEKQD